MSCSKEMIVLCYIEVIL